MCVTLWCLLTGSWTGNSERGFPLKQDKEQRGSEGGKELDPASEEAALKALRGLGQAADLSSRDGAGASKGKGNQGSGQGQRGAG